MQAVPLLDTEFLRQLICNIANYTVDVAFDGAGDIVCNAAEE
jgi:hypothetical protein